MVFGDVLFTAPLAHVCSMKSIADRGGQVAGFRQDLGNWVCKRKNWVCKILLGLMTCNMFSIDVHY